MKSEAMKVGVVGVGRVGAACASAVALGFEKENAFAIIKALEKEASVEVKAHRELTDAPSFQKRWPAIAVVCRASAAADDFEGYLE